MLSFIWLLIGIAGLVYGANFLVDGASVIAKRFNIPNIVIGLTIVAFGTSAPEMVVNLIASAKGYSDITFGNIIGSNMINVLVILGITAMIYPLKVNKNTTYIELPLSLLAAGLVLLMANDMLIDKVAVNVIGRIDGIILLIFFIMFLIYNCYLTITNEDEEELELKNYTPSIAVIVLILGFIFLVVGGKLIVDSAVSLARAFGISERVISLTIVALGTSLPELATSIVAAFKRNTDIAIGNVVGSNLFNIFFILGISSLVNPVQIKAGANIDLLVNVLAGILLFLFVVKKKSLNKFNGAVFIVIYAVYLFKLFA